MKLYRNDLCKVFHYNCLKGSDLLYKIAARVKNNKTLLNNFSSLTIGSIL
jgi:hypothetical protein